MPSEDIAGSSGEEISIVAVGDIMLGHGVETIIRQKGPDYPFINVRSALQQSDLVFGNLEAPLTKETDQVVWDYSKVVSDPIKVDGRIVGTSIYCRANPTAVKGLVYAGFDVLSIANNHIMDFGRNGLSDTVALLQEHGIQYMGAGKDLETARKPVIIDCKGIRVGFLAFGSVYSARRNRAGVAPIEYAVNDTRKLKENADIIIVSIHQGQMERYPSPAEVQLLHSIIDAGASLILRHHPHYFQGIETYKRGLIAYSLGNFVFDYEIDPTWRDDKDARESIILQCTLTKEGVKEFTATPIVIGSEFSPIILSPEKASKIMNRLSSLSDKIEEQSLYHWENTLEEKYSRTMVPVFYRIVLEILKKRRFRDLVLLLRRIKWQDVKSVLRLTPRLFSRKKGTSP